MCPYLSLEAIQQDRPMRGPIHGPCVVDDQGRIVPANSNTPELDWLADISMAPNGEPNRAILCAASLMFEALKALKRDPKHKRLDSKTIELIEEALTAAE